MAKNLFSVPIFFIVFRETLEAAIIISVLLGLAEQIVYEDTGALATTRANTRATDSDTSSKDGDVAGQPELSGNEDDSVHRKRLIRKMRIQVSVFRLPRRFLVTERAPSDLCRCRCWPAPCPRHWRSVSSILPPPHLCLTLPYGQIHRRVVYRGVGSMGKVRRTLGR